MPETALPRLAGFVHNCPTRLQQGGEPVLLVSFPYPVFKTAHRATQGRVWVSPPFSGVLLLWQRCQVPLQLVIYRLLDGADGKSQGAITHLTRLSTYLSGFHIDELFLLQLPNVLGNCVGAHPGVLANAANTGPALMRFPVLAKNQVGIDRQFAGA